VRINYFNHFDVLASQLLCDLAAIPRLPSLPIGPGSKYMVLFYINLPNLPKSGPVYNWFFGKIMCLAGGLEMATIRGRREYDEINESPLSKSSIVHPC
jgi:hypothetical protein